MNRLRGTGTQVHVLPQLKENAGRFSKESGPARFIRASFSEDYQTLFTVQTSQDSIQSLETFKTGASFSSSGTKHLAICERPSFAKISSEATSSTSRS